MDLVQAIAYTIQKEGIEIVNEKRFVNYLHDLGACAQPAIKRIMTVMAEGGYCSKLLASISNGTTALVANDIQMRLVQTEGLHNDMVSDAIKALLAAMGHTLPNENSIQPQSNVPQTGSITNDNDFKATALQGVYKIEFKGNTYMLTKQQYKSILRKKNCPDHILESWLKSYSN